MGDTENIKDNLGEEEAAEKDTETTADEKAETAGKSSSSRVSSAAKINAVAPPHEIPSAKILFALIFPHPESNKTSNAFFALKTLK